MEGVSTTVKVKSKPTIVGKRKTDSEAQTMKKIKCTN